LWNEQSEQAATDYFGCYGKAANAYFPNICEEEKIPLPNVQDRAEQAIIHILEASKEQIPFSRTLLDSIRSSGYTADSVIAQKIRNIRELAIQWNRKSSYKAWTSGKNGRVSLSVKNFSIAGSSKKALKFSCDGLCFTIPYNRLFSAALICGINFPFGYSAIYV